MQQSRGLLVHNSHTLSCWACCTARAGCEADKQDGRRRARGGLVVYSTVTMMYQQQYHTNNERRHKTVCHAKTLVQRLDVAVLIAALETPRRCSMRLQVRPNPFFDATKCYLTAKIRKPPSLIYKRLAD